MSFAGVVLNSLAAWWFAWERRSSPYMLGTLKRSPTCRAFDSAYIHTTIREYYT